MNKIKPIALEEIKKHKEDIINCTERTKVYNFLKPYLSFSLSESSKLKFIRDVDRSNASQKYLSLIHFSDYCMLEMVVNRHLISNSEIKNILANISYFIIELLNYLIIFINNCFAIYHFYKSPNLPIEQYDIFDENEKSKLHLDNIVITVIQIVILILAVVNWFIFEFVNYFQFCMMKIYNKNFLLKKSGEEKKISQVIIDYFQDKDDVSSYKFFNEVNKNFSKWKLFYVGFFHVCLINREINIC